MSRRSSNVETTETTETAADPLAANPGPTYPMISGFGKEPLSRPEAFRRLQNTLKRMGSDAERARVLAALTDLYGA